MAAERGRGGASEVRPSSRVHPAVAPVWLTVAKLPAVTTPGVATPALSAPLPSGRMVRGASRVAAGLADQALIAIANAANTVLALVLLSRDRSGAMVLCLGLAYVVLTVNRAFVGDVLVTLASRLDAERRRRLVADGLAAAVTLGAIAAAVLLVVWAFRPRAGKIDLQDLVWVAPFLPVLLLQDTGRSSYLADSAQSRALVIDLVWVGTQATATALMLLAGIRTPGAIFTGWGLGALAGAAVFVVRTKHRPWQGSPRRWLAETRYLSGWFTATQIVGQIQLQAISFIVSGRLSQRDLSGLRGGQTAMIQPTQNFVMAVQSLVVPRLSRLAGTAGSGPADEARTAAALLRRQTRLLALSFAGLAVVIVVVYVPVAHLVLSHIGKFADITPLALPLSLQAGLYMVEMPFAAALRGMHQARLLFVRYLVYTTASLTGLVVGAETNGLSGAVWGLTLGAAVGLVTIMAFYAMALRDLKETPELGQSS
jgi:hypothetical protein